MIIYLIESHLFFVRKSLWYVGELEWFEKGSRYEYAVPHMSWKNRLYYPVAYVKFMFSCIRDYEGKK